MAGHEKCCGISFWLYILIITGLVLFAGLMSGLTLGLMSLGLVDLEVLLRSGTPSDQRHAAKILPVVRNQHLLLCTLLIGNALAMEALPIFLDTLVQPWGAILISVTLILMFGEIIPQAVCSRYGLAVGAFMAPVVRVLVLIFFPVSYPISKLLDKLLGKGHVALFRRAELKTLVDMHGNEAGKGGELTHDETTIIAGALELSEKTAAQAMTPISSIFAIDVNAKLDLELMNLIMGKGHSRIPVYSTSPANIIGLILVKNLLAIRPQDELPVRNLTIRKIPRVPESMPLYDILNEFQKGHSHMAVVVKYSKEKADSIHRSKGGKSLGSRRQPRRSSDPKAVNSYKFLAVDIPEGESPQPGSPLRRHPSGTVSDASGVFSYSFPRVGLKTSLSNAKLEDEATNEAPPVSQRYKKRENLVNENILEISPESLLSFPNNEEVVGIITMEDLIEELLQEEILDETDEYIDIHNKIKVNLLPPGGRSPASPLSSSVPPSSFTHTPAPASPISSPLPNAPVSTPTWSSAPPSPLASLEQGTGSHNQAHFRNFQDDVHEAQGHFKS